MKSKNNSNPAGPNKILQPLAHQQWKIMQKIDEGFNYSEMNNSRKPLAFSEFIYRFSKSFLGVFGAILLILLIIGSFVIPFTTQDPDVTSINKYEQVFSDNHILGTDEFGRDVWARLWNGMNFSFRLAFMATLIDVMFGVLIGILMGHFPRFDKFMQFFIKIFSNIPAIMIMILATIVLKPSFWIIILGITLTGWIAMANQIRAQVKRAKNALWVTASRVLGTPQWKIILNYFPVIIPMVITQLVFTIPGVIMAETSLAVIGLSIPGMATLGNMISSGANVITLFPRLALIPSAMLVLVTVSIQFIGNSTQDALRRQR